MTVFKSLKIEDRITDRSDDSLAKYLNEIGKIRLLTVQEEVELAKRIRQGDSEAKERLVKANLRFVVSVAKQYKGNGLSLSDLINEGNVGLIKAAERFDDTRGFKFISYAVWWIRQQITQSITEKGCLVYTPKHNSARTISLGYDAFVQIHQRTPTAEELAFFTQISPDQAQRYMEKSVKHLSLDSPVAEESSITRIEMLRCEDEIPTDELFKKDLREQVDLSLGKISVRAANIIRLYYGLSGNQSHTLDEIGDKIDLTRERVRQIKAKAMRILEKNKKLSALRLN